MYLVTNISSPTKCSFLVENDIACRCNETSSISFKTNPSSKEQDVQGYGKLPEIEDGSTGPTIHIGSDLISLHAITPRRTPEVVSDTRMSFMSHSL